MSITLNLQPTSPDVGVALCSSLDISLVSVHVDWHAKLPCTRPPSPPILGGTAVQSAPLLGDLGGNVEVENQAEELQAKMQEYLEHGLKLDWLINLETQQVEVSQPGQPVSVLEQPRSLSADLVLPGFVLVLARILD